MVECEYGKKVYVKRFPRYSKLYTDKAWECPRCRNSFDPKDAWIHPCEKDKINLERAHLFTHAGCMDGSASAILFIHAGGKKENVHWVPAGNVERVMADFEYLISETSDIILLVDIAPTDMVFARRLAERGEVFIIDHHASNLQLNGMDPNFFVDPTNSACGSENFRKWLVNHGHRMFDMHYFKRFCAIIDDHDRWLKKIPFSMEMPKFFSFVGQPDFVDRLMNVKERFNYDKRSYWTPFEEDLLKLVRRTQTDKYESLYDKFQVANRNFNGREIRVAYIICDEINNSELLSTYLDRNPHVDVACQVSYGLQKVSMRSNRVDVGAWCKQYGGGGHASAAGHPLPAGQIKSIIGSMHAS